MFRILFLLFCLMPLGSIHAQEWYWVCFTDKKGVEFNPYAYFDQKAIDRRERHGLPIDHISDYPLRSDYVSTVSAMADSTSYQSRWFNALSCYLTEAQLEHVCQLPFVRSIEPLMLETFVAQMPGGDELGMGYRQLAAAQVARMDGASFQKNGLDGAGVRIAIFDAGFKGVDYGDAFEHLLNDGRILRTFDFVKKKADVYGYHQHGTMVLSNIAGIVEDSIRLGHATGAEFLLARTEKILSDGIRDEKSWLAAVEWSDKHGADIINSSLGYTSRRYFRGDMDGKTPLVTRAANMAAAKGILVVNSAGNEGDEQWRNIGAPSDADSVLTVGAINPWTNMHTSWSSFGPSADFRRKPNVTAVGHTVVYGKNGIDAANGTSFSSPLTAGFAACVLQSDSTLTAMELFQRVEQAGDLFPYYDYAHGYGVPQADKAINAEGSPTDVTFDVEEDGDKINIVIRDEYFVPAYFKNHSHYNLNTPEDKDGAYDSLNLGYYENIHLQDDYLSVMASGAESRTFPYFFWHLENGAGWLERYMVLTVEKPNVMTFSKSDLRMQLETIQSNYGYALPDGVEDSGGKPKVRFHYRGYTYTFEL